MVGTIPLRDNVPSRRIPWLNYAPIALNVAIFICQSGLSRGVQYRLGAYVLLYPRARIITLIPVFFLPPIVEIPAFFFLLVWFVTQLLSAGAQPAGGGGVAWWAHVGGFLTGMAGLTVLRATCRQRRCHEDEYAPW